MRTIKRLSPVEQRAAMELIRRAGKGEIALVVVSSEPPDIGVTVSNLDEQDQQYMLAAMLCSYETEH